MHVIRQRISSMLAVRGHKMTDSHICQNVSHSLSEMNKLTLNDSPHMIRVTPLPKIFSLAAFVKSQETNSLTSLENSSLEDSGVFMSMDKPHGTNKNVSECGSGNAETTGLDVTEDAVSSQVTQAATDSYRFTCDGNKPQLPSGVIKVSGPPPVAKSAPHLPPELLSRVTEFIRQNPKMVENADEVTCGTKRQREFGTCQRKRKKTAEGHFKVVSEIEIDSALASSRHLSPSSSELGSVHSGDGYFWDSPFLSQSDNTHVEVERKHQHERVPINCETDSSDTTCMCVLCSVEKEHRLSGASSSASAASTVFDTGDIGVLFSDTDRSDMGDDACKKSSKKGAYPEKLTKKRKQKKKKKSSMDAEMSAGIDGAETPSKKQPPNYFIAIQVANPEIHERLRAVQEDIVSSNEQLRAALVPLATLHLTLMVMRLYDSDEQLTRAKAALESCGKKLTNDLSTSEVDFSVQGLGNFRNNVIFAKVENGPILDQLSHIAETVMTTFADECDIQPVDSKGFKPHVTIMKLSRSPKLRKKGVHKIDPALYENHVETTFGRDSVQSLQLCSMFKPKDAKGYYHVAHTVSVRSYSTIAAPSGGGLMHCGGSTNCETGSEESQKEGEKGEHMVGWGTRQWGNGERRCMTFKERVEIPLEWAFHKPDCQ